MRNLAEVIVRANNKKGAIILLNIGGESNVENERCDG